MGKISSYTSVTTQSTDDLLVCDQDVSGTLTTMKTTVAKVGTAVAEVQNHANLPTTDKTLVGSITELDTDKPDTVTMTQSAWDAIADKAAWRNAHKNTLLILTDAPNLNATAQDLSYDGGATSTHDVIASKASAPTAITLTPATGVTSEYCLGAKIDKFVSGGIGFTADVTTNTWLSVGTLSVKPSATVRIPTNDSQGNYSGMVAIYNTGAIELFPKVTGTGRGIYFSFSFMTA